MALRGYDFFLIFRAKSYASSTIAKVSKDLTGMGHAAEAANAMQVGNLAALKKQAQISGLQNSLAREDLVTTQRHMVLDRTRFNNMTQRMRLEQRLETIRRQVAPLQAIEASGKRLTLKQMNRMITLLDRQIILERGIESTYLQQNVLKQRGVIISADQAAAEAHINAQLKIRQAEYVQLLAQQKALMREQALAPARAMMGRGRALTHVGALAGFAGLAGTAVLGGAAQAAGEFDKQATLAATQVGRVDQSTDQILANADRLEAAILSLMKEFPATATEMSDASYEIYSSMDINFSKGKELLKDFNEVAVAGNASLQEATHASVTVLNNFEGALRNPRKSLNDMFSIIRYGRTNLQEFNTMLDKIAPAARAGGQSLTDVGGAVAVLTRRMGPQVAATGFARLMDVFLRKDFQEGMRKSGLAITDTTGKLLPFTDVIGQIAKLGARPGADINNLIQSITAFGRGKGIGIQSTVQARRALVQLLTHYDELNTVQQKVVANQSQFNKQLAVQRQTIGVRWSIFVNQLRAIALEIGHDVVPAFEDFGRVIQPIIDAWRNLSPETRRTVAAFAAFASIAALVGGVLTAITGGIVGLVGAMRFLYTLVALRLPVGLAATNTQLAVMSRMLSDPALTGKVAMLRGLLSRLAMGGLFAIGLTLTFAGDGWTSRIGQLLLAAAVGAQVGGVPGAIVVPVALVVTWSLTDQNFRSDVGKFADKIAGFFGTKSKLFDTDQLKVARKEIEGMMKAGQITRVEANAMVKQLREESGRAKPLPYFRVPKKQLDEFVANAVAMGDAHDRAHMKMQKAVKQTMMDEIRGAKSLAEVNAIIAKYGDKGAKDDIKKLKTWRKNRADVIKGAVEDAKRILDQAADNLVNTYNQLRDANKQAFGTLFEGPWMTSPEMDFAKQWGYVPNTQDFITDLQMQINAFKRWKADLGNIAKRGAPAGLVKELQALGPEAADKLAILAKASPAQFNQFVTLWKQAQSEIDKATEADFQKQLDDWYKHGKNIAFKIIAGLESEDQFLKTRFRKMISQSFSADFIAETVQKAIQDWEKSNPKPKPTKPRPKVKVQGVNGTTGGGRVNPPREPEGDERAGRNRGGRRGSSAGAQATPESGRGSVGAGTPGPGPWRDVHYHLDRRPGESVDEYLIRVKHHFKKV